MSNLVPLAIREYIQKIALSVPIGVGVYVVGDTALDLSLGQSPEKVTFWVTGTEILSEGKHFSWEGENTKQLKFFGHLFDTYNIRHCENNNTSRVTYHNTSIEGYPVALFVINEQMSLLSLLKCLPMDILKCYVKEVASIEWESVLVNKAIERKQVQVFGQDNTLFYYDEYEYVFRDLVEQYKEKFPGFKFYMEL